MEVRGINLSFAPRKPSTKVLVSVSKTQILCQEWRHFEDLFHKKRFHCIWMCRCCFLGCGPRLSVSSFVAKQCCCCWAERNNTNVSTTKRPPPTNRRHTQRRRETINSPKTRAIAVAHDRFRTIHGSNQYVATTRTTRRFCRSSCVLPRRCPSASGLVRQGKRTSFRTC